ncbi:dihydrofolate reductase family protein, partial [Priestia flexa]|uniref:dihydrofolate reductase family protein n=1 Tax=Priestia flexa TaxID=86664 RepID=UPI002DBA84D6
MSQNTAPRKIILDLAVTLDGFIEGKNGEVDWCIMDSEMDFINFLNQIDTILYGRKSYVEWGEYTPKTGESDSDKEMWNIIHSKEKYVFSKTLKGTENKAVFINDNLNYSY